MDKIVYLYGSARDSRTRTLRRYAYPRGEMQVRIGLWLVRPARRMAVDTVRLLPYLDDLIKKVSAGQLQVQRADSSVIGLDEVRSWGVPVTPAPIAVPVVEIAVTEEPPVAAEAAVAVEAAPVAEAVAAPVEVAEEPVAETPSEPVAEVAADEPEAELETLPEPPAEVEAPRESLLPENWRQLTAKELQAFCTEHSIALTKTTKTAAVAAIESWIGGN